MGMEVIMSTTYEVTVRSSNSIFVSFVRYRPDKRVLYNKPLELTNGPNKSGFDLDDPRILRLVTSEHRCSKELT